MRSIDLNADVGEGFTETDAALIPLLTSANIACGGHAGDKATMGASVALCRVHGIAVGAHPSYPDKEGFGRRDMAMDVRELRAALIAQIDAIATVAGEAGTRLRHVKPHGALYNRAAADPVLAKVVAEAVRDVDPSLRLVGLAGSCLLTAGRAAGLRVLGEGFADRRYTAQGFLLPRSERGAVLDHPDDVRKQVISLVLDRSAVSSCGKSVSVDIDTLCLHGDGLHAIPFARLVRESLLGAGVVFGAIEP